MSARRFPRGGIGVSPPWLVIAPEGGPIVRVDLRLLDGIRGGEAGTLLLSRGDLEVAVHVADGRDAVAQIEAEAAPLLRGPDGDRARCVLVNDDPVRREGDVVHVGRDVFRADDVQAYALAGANLPLADGEIVQAALALLAYAD